MIIHTTTTTTTTTTGVALLKDDYIPGDLGFDPLGLKPDTEAGFELVRTRELQNGRLAMLAIAGMVAQELVNGQPILVNLGWEPA